MLLVDNEQTGKSLQQLEQERTVLRQRLEACGVELAGANPQASLREQMQHLDAELGRVEAAIYRLEKRERTRPCPLD